MREKENTNRFFRSRDGADWEHNPLVLGYEIRLSATAKKHEHCDKCVLLAGLYPVDFDWNGWHDDCICFKIPILMDNNTMAKYQKLVAQGLDTEEAIEDLQKDIRISEPPIAYKIYIASHE